MAEEAEKSTDDTAAAAHPIKYDKDNIFSKIIDGTIPSFKIFETEEALAFLDAFPMAPGHFAQSPIWLRSQRVILGPAEPRSRWKTGTA